MSHLKVSIYSNLLQGDFPQRADVSKSSLTKLLVLFILVHCLALIKAGLAPENSKIEFSPN